MDVDVAELHEDFARAMRTYLAGLPHDRPVDLPDLAVAILRSGRDESVGLLAQRLSRLDVDLDGATSTIESLLEPIVANEEFRYEQESIGSDFWTTRDTVGISAFADAIARGIQHEETRPPLTIGIKAPWGAGKTSLMRMIRERLEWPTTDHPSHGRLRGIRLDDPMKRALVPDGNQSVGPLPDVKNRDLLDSLRSRTRQSKADEETKGGGSEGSDGVQTQDVRPGAVPATPSPPKAQPESSGTTVAGDEQRWRPTIWFNPWMYQTGDQVWAGLAHEIITQVTDRMTSGEREHFWLKLNIKRVDEHAVRRKIYGLVIDRVLPYALVAVLALVAGVVLLAVGAADRVGTGLVAAAPVLFGATTAISRRKVLDENVSGTLSQLLGPATTIRRLTAEQLGGAYGRLVDSPDYKSQTGFFYLVWTDMQRVLDLVAGPGRPLVVFVDDLDRCSPGTVVQVIEAINLFLAGQFPNCVFVIAMEPEMVAAHIEAAYADLVKRLEAMGPEGRAVDLGWKFLEKIVQLPLTMPDMAPDRTKVFFESQFQAQMPDDRREPTATETEVRAAEREFEGSSLEDIGEIVENIGAGSTSAEKEAVRRFVDRRLSSDDPEVQKVIAYAVDYLQPNPREIKRFVNVFRFFVMIDTERKLKGLSTTGSLSEIAKLAVLSLRWPGLISSLGAPVALGDERTVFDLLEDPPHTPERGRESPESAELRGLTASLENAGLSKATIDRLLTAELRRFMKSEPKAAASATTYF